MQAVERAAAEGPRRPELRFDLDWQGLCALLRRSFEAGIEVDRRYSRTEVAGLLGAGRPGAGRPGAGGPGEGPVWGFDLLRALLAELDSHLDGSP